MYRTKKGLWAAALGVGVLALSITGSAFAAKTRQASPPSLVRTRLVTYIAGVVGEPDAAHLQQDLKAGKSLLQIAEANNRYHTTDALATAILAPVKTQMDSAAKQNSSLATGEATLYRKLHARIVTLVQTQHPLRALRSLGSKSRRRGPAGAGLLQTMVSACGAKDAASLVAAFQAGSKSPLAICRATAPTMTQYRLVSALMAAIKTKLDAITNGNGTLAPHESQILTQIQARLDTWAVAPLPSGVYHP